MFITEMIFTNKHYHRQADIVACIEVCKELPIESLHTSHCATSGTYQAWWTFQKISICFKASFGSAQEMYHQCLKLSAVPQLPTYDRWSNPVEEGISHKAFGEILRILENKA